MARQRETMDIKDCINNKNFALKTKRLNIVIPVNQFCKVSPCMIRGKSLRKPEYPNSFCYRTCLDLLYQYYP